MIEFQHLIRFEDVIYRIIEDLEEINPKVIISGEKKRYSDLDVNGKENAAFNTLIATGYNIICELQIKEYIKTSIENAEVDIAVDDLLTEKIFRNSTIDKLLAKLVENTEDISLGISNFNE